MGQPRTTRAGHREHGPLLSLVVAVALLAVVGLVPAAAAAQLPTSTTQPVPSSAGGTGVAPGPSTTTAAQPEVVVPPLSARFDPGAQMAPELSANEVYLETADRGPDQQPLTIWVVRFATGFQLPDDGYRVSIVAGDPLGQQVRASLLVAGGAPSGVVETGNGQTWDVISDTGARFDPAGIVRIEGPSNPAFSDPASSVWVTAELPGGEGTIQSPVFSVGSLVGAGATPTLDVARWGTVSDSSAAPTGEFIEGLDGPTVALSEGNIHLALPGPPPSDLRGNPATDVVDRVWIGTQTTGGSLPWAVTVNQTRGQIVLYDFTTGFPVAVTGSTTWLVQGLPPGGAPAGPYELVFSVQGLADALGFSATDATLALGLDRTVALVDGRLVSFDGVTALSAWFEGTAGSSLPAVEDDLNAVEPPTTAGPAAGSSSDSNTGVLYAVLGILAVAVLAGVIGWLIVRRRSRPDPDLDEKEGRRPHAAGVSPDDALAALSRTVDEVSAKIDADATTRTKTVSPPTPGSDRARAEGGPAAQREKEKERERAKEMLQREMARKRDQKPDGEQPPG